MNARSVHYVMHSSALMYICLPPEFKFMPILSILDLHPMFTVTILFMSKGTIIERLTYIAQRKSYNVMGRFGPRAFISYGSNMYSLIVVPCAIANEGSWAETSYVQTFSFVNAQ